MILLQIKLENKKINLLTKGLLSLMFLFSFSTIFSQPAFSSPKTKAIITSEVLTKIDYLQSQLEIIRNAIGKNKNAPPPYSVNDAAPREVYFEAQALFDKANRFAYEVTGTLVSTPKLNDLKNIQLNDTLNLVLAAIRRIDAITLKLNIKNKDKVASLNNTQATPTDLFNQILVTNALLDHLLYQKTAPSNVYEQVTLSIDYTDELLNHFHQDTNQQEPKLISNKTPQDVFIALINCLQVIKKLSVSANIPMLSINYNQKENFTILPSDVFNIAKIILSEVKFLDTYIIEANNKRSILSYQPFYKTPSEVYQKVGLLSLKLKLLEKVLAQNPTWQNKLPLQALTSEHFIQMNFKKNKT